MPRLGRSVVLGWFRIRGAVAAYCAVVGRWRRTSLGEVTDGASAALLGVGVRFGRAVVLDGIDFAVPSGSCIAISGANGAGKTTLLRVLAGVFRPNAGRRVGPSSCAYVPAVVEHTSISAGKWLAGVPRQKRTNSHEMLAALGFDGDLRSDCRALSFGNSRKLLLAEALSSGEQLIVVDEVSAGLDQRGLDGLFDTIGTLRSSGCSFVLADQQSRPVVIADASFVVADGGLHPDGKDGCASVRVTGPRKNLDSLIVLADNLGFTVDEDRR